MFYGLWEENEKEDFFAAASVSISLCEPTNDDANGFRAQSDMRNGAGIKEERERERERESQILDKQWLHIYGRYDTCRHRLRFCTP